MLDPRFLVVSLGNQAPYSECLHSAGHMALVSIQKLLYPAQPPFSSERVAKKSAHVSVGRRYIMLQSPTQMNISGPWVARAWKEYLADNSLDPTRLALILVHDDLEQGLGAVKIRSWESSHRGHNGVKSVNASLHHGDYKGAKWARISVGIGRPAERDRSTVADYVLRPMSKYQKTVISDVAGPRVLAALRELEDQWSMNAAGEAGAEASAQTLPGSA